MFFSRIILLIILLVSFLSFTVAATAKQAQKEKPMISGIVVRIIDGDTFVLNDIEIRLWGVNTPERDEPHFEEAKTALAALLKTLQSCRVKANDKYGRAVAQCYARTDVGSFPTIDIGAALVASGLAQASKQYSHDYYIGLEHIAMQDNIGIWKKEGTSQQAPSD